MEPASLAEARDACQGTQVEKQFVDPSTGLLRPFSGEVTSVYFSKRDGRITYRIK